LYSSDIDTFYVGQTVNIINRLEEHLHHLISDAFTKRASDWKLFYKLDCENKRQAIMIESHIKRMKSRKYYENLRAFPEIGENLLMKYRVVPGSSR